MELTAARKDRVFVRGLVKVVTRTLDCGADARARSASSLSQIRIVPTSIARWRLERRSCTVGSCALTVDGGGGKVPAGELGSAGSAGEGRKRRIVGRGGRVGCVDSVRGRSVPLPNEGQRPLFFIEMDSRRVHLAGCTANSTGAWMTQQTRQVARHSKSNRHASDT